MFLATKFTVSSASSAVLTEVNKIVVSLFVGISGDIKLNAKLGLDLVIKVSVQLVTLLNGALSGLLGVRQ